jgi:iron(III)-enterobactin esterase
MTSFWENPFSSLRRMMNPNSPSLRQIRHQYSPILERELSIDVYLPPDYRRNKHLKYPLLIVNDGQDLPRMGMVKILENLYLRKQIPPIIVVGIHADDNRMREYGTANQVDYKGRGDRADAYKSFIVNELVGFLMSKYRIIGRTEQTAIAGFSLGGLSAFDIGWAVPEIFGTIGVFSGALWWRSREVNPKHPDADRIMHTTVQNSTKNDGQYFWFEAGTDDEIDDRNNNGIIDAIDDTLDLMRILKQKGYSDDDLRYIEIKDGRHDPQTWGIAMPDFLIWTFG